MDAGWAPAQSPTNPGHEQAETGLLQDFASNMTLFRMGDFVGQDPRNFVRVLGFLDEAALDDQASTGHRKGIDLWVLDQVSMQTCGVDPVGGA